MGKQFEQRGGHKSRRSFNFTSDTVVTNDSGPTSLTLAAYHTDLVSGGSAGAEDLTIPDGEYLGQRKSVTMKTLTDGSDSVVLDGANLEDVSITFDDEGDYVLLEWNGAVWVSLYETATAA